MKDKILVTLIVMTLLVVSLSVASAGQVYRQDTNIDLKVPCLNNNTYCSQATTCNITIIDSESVVIVDNELMQNQTAYQNYTFNVTHSANSGEYTRNIICSDGGVSGYSSDTFIITPTGNAFDDASSFATTIILVLMFGVTIFFFLFSKQTVNPAIQLFFTLISYLTMTLTVGAGWVLLQNSGVQTNVSPLITTLLYIVAIVFIIIMYYVFINITKQSLALWKTKKGFDDGDDYEY